MVARPPLGGERTAPGALGFRGLFCLVQEKLLWWGRVSAPWLCKPSCLLERGSEDGRTVRRCADGRRGSCCAGFV